MADVLDTITRLHQAQQKAQGLDADSPELGSEAWRQAQWIAQLPPVNRTGWEAFLAQAPMSRNVEDRRNMTWDQEQQRAMRDAIQRVNIEDARKADARRLQPRLRIGNKVYD